MDFIAKEINKKYAKFLVFGISAESPLSLLPEIKEQLNLIKDDIVIFDQLLQTGNAENRFLLLTFGNEEFDLYTARHLDSTFVDTETKSIVSEFLRKNTTVLRYSILLTQQKDTILQGGFI